MIVRELTFRGEDKPVLYACGTCGTVFSPKSFFATEGLSRATARRLADECCAQRHCACGREIEKHWTACQPCRERRKLLKAKVIGAGEYTGPVYSDGVSGDWTEGYSSDLDALHEYCHDHEEPLPAYVHPCTSQLLQLDAERILESATDDMHEDAADQIVDADDVYEFVKAFNEKQTCTTWYSDTSEIIVIEAERFAELVAEPSAETTASVLIRQERDRQINVEHWSPEHDDAYLGGELTDAAGFYLHHGQDSAHPVDDDGVPHGWPWDKAWWKPKSRQRNLVRAGALCLAEKDRRERAGEPTSPAEHKLALVIRHLVENLNSKGAAQ